MNKKEKEEEEPKCLRCGSSAKDSGIPSICVSCGKEMEALVNRINGLSDIRILYLKGKSVDFILRRVREDCLKTLNSVLAIEKERGQK